MLGLAKYETTGYQPQANGQVERFHRFLGAALTVLARDNKANWDEFLPHVLFAYRVSTQRSTGYSPFRLMYGRDPTLPTDLLLREDRGGKGSYVEELAARLVDTFRRAREMQTKVWQEGAGKKRLPQKRYKGGDLVLIWTPGTRDGTPKKLMWRWRGPFPE